MRLGVLAAVALLAAGCGSSSTGGGAAPTTTGGNLEPQGQEGGTASTTLQVQAAEDSLKFSATILNAAAGKVTLVLTNPSSTSHNIAIRGHGVNVVGKVVTDGGKSTVAVELKAHTQYEFYCSVDGHADAGMRGFINVGDASNPSG